MATLHRRERAAEPPAVGRNLGRVARLGYQPTRDRTPRRQFPWKNDGIEGVPYSAPGRLVIDPSPSGFTFDVDIERSGSAGIGNMKIFCYDLMLARLWSDHSATPGVLVHDSSIFDGVDERQRALALELAASEAKAHGFQYIRTLNSDYVPWGEFSPGFNPQDHIRLRLTDADVAGCLLGVRF
jgi:uncharacterized protein YydD (DUF2326 family)